MNVREACLASWKKLDPRMYIDEGTYLQAFNLKSGSTTIKKRHNRGPYLARSEAQAFNGPIRLYMRDPIERFISGWRYFSYDRLDLRIDKGNKPDHCTLEEWFDYIRSPGACTNLHWVPVTTVHTYEGRFLPTEVLPLSKFPSLRTNESSAKDHYNAYLDAEWHMREPLVDWYADDFEVWDQIKFGPLT